MRPIAVKLEDLHHDLLLSNVVAKCVSVHNDHIPLEPTLHQRLALGLVHRLELPRPFEPVESHEAIARRVFDFC